MAKNYGFQQEILLEINVEPVKRFNVPTEHI
jgi:hypothetical protein